MKYINICYRLIVFLIANEYKRLTSFQAFIFPHLVTMDRAGKKVRCSSAARKWAASRRETRRRVEHGHGPTYAKGYYGKGTKKRGEHRHFFAYERMRHYYRPRARRANCTRNWIPLSRPPGLACPVTTMQEFAHNRDCRLSARSDTSQACPCSVEKNRRSWVINDIQAKRRTVFL